MDCKTTSTLHGIKLDMSTTRGFSRIALSHTYDVGANDLHKTHAEACNSTIGNITINSSVTEAPFSENDIL